MDKDSHKRYLHQANWTRELREYIFKEVGLNKASRALEVGCGTGAILSKIDFPVYGLDLNLRALKEAQIHLQASSSPPRSNHFSDYFARKVRLTTKKKGRDKSRVTLTCGNAFALPYANSSFEIIFCHFLLLWLPNPADAIKEMMRVAVPNGHIIFFAEPDYSQRIDKPEELTKLGKWQSDALRVRGANPDIGGKLAELCYETGITIIETGTLQKSTREASANERANEWETLKSDLRGRVPVADIQKMKILDDEAWARGNRISDIPTYYLWGRNQV